ncbi:conserved exported protein of unknown function [Pseudorhizobium banfieldiae]|uniref:Protein Atu4866 n=1 Tax=Pseudorhizobium banfieldiae TaxID=1125847 RepID=L0NH05_9HYPH|nr:Atu4866 domain-containing protein [Pseudorhizobium banfieldiae]CAD6614980.1 hypothetical protein RNT25_02752 [arsenite-oxidising bacterium NT-25]CCF20134.1 conserved exported protein of unknown function [Pseudorhizobium banfieldiae]
MAECGLRHHLALAAFAAAFVFIAGVTAFAADGNQEIAMSKHPYVGLWVSQDDYIRYELLPNGRYFESHGFRERVYHGEYRVTGDHIDYKDDSGFIADGEFRNDVLYHAGVRLMRA